MEKFDSNQVTEKWDAIVIGSGIGGLATAALLSNQGKKVLVLESHYAPGGFTHTFKRKGYEWDVGLHYIGEVHRERALIRTLFDHLTDKKLKWSHMPPVYDKIIFPDKEYDLVAGRENFINQLIGHFPDEREAIEKYLKAVNDVSKASRNFFLQKALPSLAGQIARPFLTKKFLKYSNKTTKEVIESFTKNKKLLGVLTGQYGNYGLSPSHSSFAIHALVVKHYMNGGNYPIGGSAEIANTIIPTIEKNGSKVFVRARVSEVIIKEGAAVGVKMEGGTRIFAKKVISNTGAINTYKKLIGHANSYDEIFQNQLKQVGPSVAHLCVYIGLKESSKDLNLPKSNYWIYPGYDHDQSIEDYIDNKSSPPPVTYISFPSAKDPTWEARYPGRSTIEVLGLAPFEWFAKWQNEHIHKRGKEYEEFKEKMIAPLMENLYKHIPQVKGKIDYYEISTPLSTRHYCNYETGEIYGLEHTPNRFRQKWLKPQTPIKNFYLTGQDIVSDGVGGALFSGVLTASAILKNNVLKGILAKR